MSWAVCSVLWTWLLFAASFLFSLHIIAGMGFSSCAVGRWALSSQHCGSRGNAKSAVFCFFQLSSLSHVSIWSQTGKLKFFNFFFPGKCFITVKVLGNRSIKSCLSHLCQAWTCFALQRCWQLMPRTQALHLPVCPSFKPAAKSLLKSIRSFPGPFSWSRTLCLG